MQEHDVDDGDLMYSFAVNISLVIRGFFLLPGVTLPGFTFISIMIMVPVNFIMIFN